MEITDAGAPAAFDPPRTGTGVGALYLERVGLRRRLNKEGAWLFLVLLMLGTGLLMPFLKSNGLWISLPCWFNKVTGLPCLTCGLTRSISLCTHGDLYEAARMHLLGPPIFVLACGYIMYWAVSMARGVRLRIRLSPRSRRIAFWSVLGIFCACWVIKLVFMRGTW